MEGGIGEEAVIATPFFNHYKWWDLRELFFLFFHMCLKNKTC